MEQQCPDCKSDQLTTTAEHSIMLNTGEHYCHSVKHYDPDSKVKCLDCGWTGIYKNLKGI